MSRDSIWPIMSVGAATPTQLFAETRERRKGRKEARNDSAIAGRTSPHTETPSRKLA